RLCGPSFETRFALLKDENFFAARSRTLIGRIQCEAPIQATNELSSLRTQGPITTGWSLWRERWDGFPPHNKYHAVWVPAFEGTTDESAWARHPSVANHGQCGYKCYTL